MVAKLSIESKEPMVKKVAQRASGRQTQDGKKTSPRPSNNLEGVAKESLAVFGPNLALLVAIRKAVDLEVLMEGQVQVVIRWSEGFTGATHFVVEPARVDDLDVFGLGAIHSAHLPLLGAVEQLDPLAGFLIPAVRLCLAQVVNAEVLVLGFVVGYPLSATHVDRWRVGVANGISDLVTRLHTAVPPNGQCSRCIARAGALLERRAFINRFGRMF